MSMSLQELIIEQIKLNLVEGYKDDPKKLRAMRQSGTRGTGLSDDDVRDEMSAKYNLRAIKSLIVSKFDPKKVQNLVKSRLQSVADKLNIDLSLTGEKYTANLQKHTSQEEFGYVNLNLQYVVDFEQSDEKEFTIISLTFWKDDGKIISYFDVKIGEDYEQIEIASVSPWDRNGTYNSITDAIEDLVTKTMNVLNDDNLYIKLFKNYI